MGKGVAICAIQFTPALCKMCTLTIIRPLSAAARDCLYEQLPQCISLLTTKEFFRNCLMLLTPQVNGVAAVFEDYEQLRVKLVRKLFPVKERVQTPRGDTFWLSLYFKGKGCITFETSPDFSNDRSEVCKSQS